MMLLEKIYRRLLRESAWPQNPSRAARKELSGEELSAKIIDRVERAYSENLALCDLSMGKSRQILVLYKPGPIFDIMIKYAEEAEEQVQGDPATADQDVMRPQSMDERGAKLLKTVKHKFVQGIVGMVDIAIPSSTTGNCHGASVVQFSASDDGYGPMLYDIAMTFAPNGRIMSDRISVTVQAAEYYKKLSSRPDITAEPLVKKTRDNPDDPAACKIWGEKFPERQFLDYAYSRSTDFDATKLLDAHDSTVSAVEEMLVELGFKPRDIDAAVRDGFRAASSLFFSKKYEKVAEKDLVSIYDR